MLYLVLINGLIDSINPCAIGVLLSYIAIALSLKIQRKTFATFGIIYIATTYAVYLLIGIGILRVFHIFDLHNFFGWLAALFILIIGLFNLKEFFLPELKIPLLSSFFNKCRIIKWKPEFTILSALILGFLIAVCEFPCSGGIYLATVSLLSAKETFLNGIFYLLLYNLMFISPLLIIFLSLGNKKIFSLIQNFHAKSFKLNNLFMGLSMIFAAAALLYWLILSVK